MKEITSNQYYGAINRRADKRTLFLKRLGFTFVTNEFGAFMVRTTLGSKPRVISMSSILLSNNRLWRDTLSWTLKRG